MGQDHGGEGKEKTALVRKVCPVFVCVVCTIRVSRLFASSCCSVNMSLVFAMALGQMAGWMESGFGPANYDLSEEFSISKISVQ